MPKSCPSGKDEFLHLADHHELDGQIDKARVYETELVMRRQHTKGAWWLEAGPDLPVGVELVEVPLHPTSEGRCKVNLIVDGKALVGPGSRLARVREMTPTDEKVLEAVRKTDRQASDLHVEMLKVARDAEDTVEGPEAEIERNVSATAFLAANYTKKGKAERQEQLFPELEEEIRKGKEALCAGVKWPDQSTEEYKDEVVNRSEKLINPKLSKRQKTSLITRILRPFSIAFWMAGCSAPRVEGFTASIQLKPDAQPRVQQPCKLSAFDQKRLEYHEDVEVAEGKAVWAEPGGPYCWGSPSFVVDQTGKGVLGRPVRDYRWPNSQTLDAAWPAADAEACLRRAQAGSVHTSLDWVWGFTQCGVTEETSKILALVARRGLLLPKVLYFGPKQGPGIFPDGSACYGSI